MTRFGGIRRSRIARVVGALACCCFLFLAFEIALVPTGSMERTVLVGDHVLVFKLFDAPRIPGTSLRLPRLRAPHRGSLVSFLPPAQPNGTVYLKRVVAVAGDTVEIRDGIFYLNGSKEPYAVRSMRIANRPAQHLRQGELFVLGDNRDLSEDSRDFGPIAVDSVVGTPSVVVWSARARTPDLLDGNGDVRPGFYWTAVRHLIASTRWSRTGKLL